MFGKFIKEHITKNKINYSSQCMQIVDIKTINFELHIDHKPKQNYSMLFRIRGFRPLIKTNNIFMNLFLT